MEKEELFEYFPESEVFLLTFKISLSLSLSLSLFLFYALSLFDQGYGRSIEPERQCVVLGETFYDLHHDRRSARRQHDL